MSYQIIIRLIHLVVGTAIRNEKLAGLISLLFASLFAVMGVSSFLEAIKLPNTPTVATTTQVAETLSTQNRFWITISNPQWDCTTLTQSTVGKTVNTEVFINDSENSVAILVSFSGSKQCGELPEYVTGVAYPMHQRHIEILQRSGRLADPENYRSISELCTTCGRRSWMSLTILSIILTIASLSLYPLVLLAKHY